MGATALWLLLSLLSPPPQHLAQGARSTWTSLHLVSTGREPRHWRSCP